MKWRPLFYVAIAQGRLQHAGDEATTVATFTTLANELPSDLEFRPKVQYRVSNVRSAADDAALQTEKCW